MEQIAKPDDHGDDADKYASSMLREPKVACLAALRKLSRLGVSVEAKVSHMPRGSGTGMYHRLVS